MRKWLHLCAAVAAMAICIASGYMIGMSSSDEDCSADTAVMENIKSDPIAQFRTERQQLRQMQTAQLNEMIYGGTADDEVIELAKRKLLELLTWSEQETTLEGVLSMREFEDAVVTVHTDSVNVIIRTDVLNQQQSAVILELVQRETGISGTNVKIIPIN